MRGKAVFVDTTVCTACRGCQVACKQWHQLPATKTENRGSYQNPQDLSFDTYKLVRFQEHLGPDNKPQWYFFPDQCRHCLEPSCLEAAEDSAPGGVIIDNDSGAVLYTDKLKKADPEAIIEACPFNIPRVEKTTGQMAKCTFCVDRTANGLVPACVKTCPTGAMNFGDRDEMAGLAKRRLAEVKARFPKASVTGLEDLRVFYLLADEPKKFHPYAAVGPAARGIDRNVAMKRISRSLKELSREWLAMSRLIT